MLAVAKSHPVGTAAGSLRADALAAKQIGAKLAGLAGQAGQHGGDPALLDGLPMFGDLLLRLPDRIKQQLFEAFDLAMLYHKEDGQVTCRATITPSTPAALAAIIAQSETPDLAALLTSQDHPSDLSRHPGAAKTP